MKTTKILLATAALAFSLTAFSQTDTTKKDSTHKSDITNKKLPSLTEGATTNLQDKQSVTTQQATTTTTRATNITSSEAAKNNAANTVTGTSKTYNSAAVSTTQSLTPKPNFGRYYIPVLGSYNAVATTTDNKSITVTGDETNPGKVWVDGLSGSKFYALLKTVPGTYKIPAQKEGDNNVAEGTLIYDESDKQINICLGCGYNDQTPVAIEAVASTTPAHVKGKNYHQVEKIKKVPVISFSGSRADQGTVSILQ
jgi:hypothetical protein